MLDKDRAMLATVYIIEMNEKVTDDTKCKLMMNICTHHSTDMNSHEIAGELTLYDRMV